jgi:ABC-type bacteriocin/lantibiotic exporter with double-glycine peptidase domain
LKSSIFNQGIPNVLLRLWRHLTRRRRRQFGLLLGLMLVSAVTEVVSLGAVLPFLGILTVPEQVFNYPIVASLASELGIASANELILPLTVTFVAAALIAAAVRLLLIWANIRFSNACGADLSIQVYRRTLYQPYRVHVARNSSEVLSGISKVASAQSVLQAVLTLVSSSVLVVSIILALLAINAEVATMAAICFGISYAVIVKLSRWRLERNSKCVARETTRMLKALQEGLGGIRDILLDGTQILYSNIYRESQLPALRAQGSNQFITTCPRYIMEALGMVLIAALAYGLSRQDGGVAAAMPVLGALALGAQRLLPAIQQLYSGWAGITGNQASLADALDLLDQPLPEDVDQLEPAPLSFKQTIHFNKVQFRYGEDGPWVLDGLDLNIPKGARIGFVGSTGSGKSTTMDLLMGLLEPVNGKILVDGLPIVGKHRRAWQRTIAHVPQTIYLADTTLAENIAFGAPKEAIDMERVQIAASQAQIAGFIEDQPEKYESFIGERGVRLSGGQRQRIGIARALYKQASVLVFDEATSALDNATEKAVVDAIGKFNRDLTILLIAHRLTTVRHCDTIFELDRGRVVAQGTYEKLLERSSSFRNMAQSSI